MDNGLVRDRGRGTPRQCEHCPTILPLGELRYLYPDLDSPFQSRTGAYLCPACHADLTARLIAAGILIPLAVSDG